MFFVVSRMVSPKELLINSHVDRLQRKDTSWKTTILEEDPFFITMLFFLVHFYKIDIEDGSRGQ